MKKTSGHADKCGKYLSLFVLAVRSVIESAVFFGLIFLAKFLYSKYGSVVLYFAVPVAVVILGSVVIPLRYGTILFFLNREKEGKSSVGDQFAFFSPALFFSAVRNGLGYFLFFLLCFLTFFLPCISMFALMCYNILNLSSLFLSASCFAAFLVLFLIGASAFLKIKRLTFLSRYLFVLSPKKRGLESLLESAEMLNGRSSFVTAVKMKNFFSRLFCVFVFPVGFIVRRCMQRNAHMACELLKESK